MYFIIDIYETAGTLRTHPFMYASVASSFAAAARSDGSY
jgi:hypothetical protein